MEKYAALIFDIVDSRHFDNRKEVQELIKNVLNYLNNYYSQYIKKEVICGAGDEFQGLFKNIFSAFAFARKLQLYIYPIKIRCGIGYGTLKYFVEDWISTEIDGEAYYNARDSLKNIPNKGTNVIFFKTNLLDDKFFNSFSLVNAKVKTKESSIGRLIELLIDLFYPLDIVKDSFNDKDGEILQDIINFHYHDTQYLRYSTSKKRFYGECLYDKNKIDFRQIFNQVKNHQKIIVKNEYFYEDYIPWGVGKLLEPILNTSQQNINQHINLRGVKDSRSIDAAIFNTIKRIEEER